MERIQYFRQRNQDLDRVVMWIITADHLSEWEADKKQIEAEKTKHNLTREFRLYDDDGELYYSGWYSDDIEDEFYILQWAMYDSGCTEMQTKNSEGRWEVL